MGMVMLVLVYGEKDSRGGNWARAVPPSTRENLFQFRDSDALGQPAKSHHPFPIPLSLESTLVYTPTLGRHHLGLLVSNTRRKNSPVYTLPSSLVKTTRQGMRGTVDVEKIKNII